MKIPTETVAEVVKEASSKMTDPNYSAVMVGGFVQSQGPTSKYISAHEQEVGGADGVVNVIFHAALISQCFQRAHNRSLREMTFEDLNQASDGDRRARLAAQQPALLEYLDANVEDEAMKNVLMLVALAMDWVS